MDKANFQLCRDCRYSKLTVKADNIAFRCVKHSWPCHDEWMQCDSFRDYFSANGHEIIKYAWLVTGKTR